MSRDALHTTLDRFSVLAVIFMITGAVTGVRAMPYDTAMDSPAATVHTEGMQNHETECTGDGCGVCDSSTGDDHFTEHCPDCLAQMPAMPGTVRVDRHLSAAGSTIPDALATDNTGCQTPSLSRSPARSGPAPRSPVLRL